MLIPGGSPRRARRVAELCLGGFLALGLATGAVAQNAEAGSDAKESESQGDKKQSDNKPWTSESHNDPEQNRAPRWQGPRMETRLSGIVRLSSGVPPQPSVQIFFCGQAVGSTDENGRFHVTAPSAGPLQRSRTYSSCEFSIHFPGAKLLRFRLPRTGKGFDPEIRLGALVLELLPGYGGGMTSVTTLEAPKRALRAYRRATREEAQPKPNLEKTAAHYREAVAAYPQFAEAWTGLGRVRLAAGDLDAAMTALETAIAADQSFPPPYRVLLRIRMQRRDLEPAAVLATALLRLAPGDGEARYFHALATFGLRRYDEAASSAQALIDNGEGERFPQAFQILGEIHVDRGELEAAARNFRAYLKLAPDAPSAPGIRERLHAWISAGIAPPDPEPAEGNRFVRAEDRRPVEERGR